MHDNELSLYCCFVFQTSMLRRFFSLFYFSINAGSVISTLLTPVLRSTYVSDCYR